MINSSASDSDCDDTHFAEEIMNQKTLANGQILYQVRWQYYPEEEDFTWEPADNLDPELVESFIKNQSKARNNEFVKKNQPKIALNLAQILQKNEIEFKVMEKESNASGNLIDDIPLMITQARQQISNEDEIIRQFKLAWKTRQIDLSQHQASWEDEREVQQKYPLLVFDFYARIISGNACLSEMFKHGTLFQDKIQ